METCHKWMHHLGFEVLDSKKGLYVDGHEREDVVESCKSYLRRMASLGFITKEEAPTEECKRGFPEDFELPTVDVIQKTIFIFHDESAYQANEDQVKYWGESGSNVIKPKSKGSGINVSDFIEEHDGFLQLSLEQYEQAKVTNPNIKLVARTLLEYGESREGYWTSDKFMKQVKEASEIAEFKYPREKGYKLVWLFDHSGCHTAMASDALVASRMNAGPGGKQPVMRDTYWQGQLQRLVDGSGRPIGARALLDRRGVNTKGLKVEELRSILSKHPDFLHEKTQLEHLLNSRGHVCYFIPKFHCELNPIERCWSQSKRYTRAHCNYSITGLRKNIAPALESISVENIRNYYDRVRRYMYGYLEGLSAGGMLENRVKEFKKTYRSHRRVGVDV